MSPIPANARRGAVALLVAAPLHALLTVLTPDLAPLALASWLGVGFGVLCLCEELGAARPLNRGGLVLFAAAFVARLLMALAPDSPMGLRAQILFSLATFGALLCWSAALAHRQSAARALGAAGVAVVGSALALSVVAHVLLGTLTIWGFSGLYLALAAPSGGMAGASGAVCGVLAVWSVAVGALLWRVDLRA